MSMQDGLVKEKEDEIGDLGVQLQTSVDRCQRLEKELADVTERVKKAESKASEASDEHNAAVALAQSEVKALRQQCDAFEAEVAKRGTEMSAVRAKLAGLCSCLFYVTFPLL